MKRILLLSMVFSFVLATTSWAQRTVSGKVTDDTGEGLPGVNVVIKGTTTGTTTDLDGNYQISVSDDNTVLVYSSVSMATQEVAVGTRSTIEVEMASDTKVLGEIVVTALGIPKAKASLGYGVSNIGGDELANSQESDIARLLRGKATGVDITQTSGLAGSGTNIIIRGYSSLSGSNQPLFVVDGIPFNTDTNSANQSFTTGSATASSRFLDLDPNNIVEVSILKGLSATVLYGEYGRNGVILVTTKNGQGGSGAAKKNEISITQGVYQTEIANLPDYQDTFGNGFSSSFGWFFSNWGAAFNDLNPSSYGYVNEDNPGNFRGVENGQVLIVHPYDQEQYNDAFPEYVEVDYIYQPHKSVENFFQKGNSSVTSVAIQSRLDENSSVSASYSYLTEEGFTPKLDEMRGGGRSNYFDKHNFGIGARTKLQNGLKVQGSFNYVNSDRLTPITAPAFGSDGNGLFAAILFTPRSMDLLGLPYQSPIDGSNVYYRRGSAIQNPRWTLNNSGQTEKIARFFSATTLSYDITDNVSVFYRFSLDKYDQKNSRYINDGGPRQTGGTFQTTTIGNTITDQVYNVIYNFNLTPELILDGVVGVNFRREVGEGIGSLSSEQFIYNLFTHSNFTEHDGYSYIREENNAGVYATATLGYRHFLYLNLKGRNDWTSTLEEENRSVLYPSADVAFIVTEAIPGLQSNNLLNYLKLRVGYGTSAGYPNPYQTRSTLGSATRVFQTGEEVLNINTVSNFLGNSNLTAEIHKEVEVGVEGKFWKNRIGLDLSLYKKKSSDLIIALDLDPSTGYTGTAGNPAVVINKGIELGINTNFDLPGAVKWTMNWNYTKNINRVRSISDDIELFYIDGLGSPGNYGIAQETYGVIYGTGFLRNDEGKIIVDGQGEYREGENQVIGDPNPNFTMNWLNGFSWKGISFDFHWQYIDGGDIYSSTIQALLARGNTSDTDVDRTIPIILPNAVKVVTDEDGKVVKDEDGNETFVENDIQTYIGDSFFSAYLIDEGGIFDATVIRLRRVSVGYVFQKKLLKNTPFGSLSFVLSGENLFYNAPNTPKGINFDPELSSTGVGNGRGLDYRTAPTAKKIGATLTLKF